MPVMGAALIPPGAFPHTLSFALACGAPGAALAALGAHSLSCSCGAGIALGAPGVDLECDVGRGEEEWAAGK